MDSLTEYINYHWASSLANDIDPQNDCLSYVSERYELNTEQRYWLAFLFGTCYCAPTVFYIYNEFPDFETVNVDRLQRWWNSNKARLVFQTDRARVRSNDQFVNCFRSYRNIVGGSQRDYFLQLEGDTPKATYAKAFKNLSEVHYFGRFTMFIYLEMVSVLTQSKMIPTDLDLRNAESCRNGLALALNRRDVFTHFDQKTVTKADYDHLEAGLLDIQQRIEALPIRHRDIFSIETTLCAFKKAKLGKRYVGYYIDRMHKEITAMQSNVPRGVDWSVLWDFRKKNYEPKYLLEQRKAKK